MHALLITAMRRELAPAIKRGFGLCQFFCFPIESFGSRSDVHAREANQHPALQDAKAHDRTSGHQTPQPKAAKTFHSKVVVTFIKFIRAKSAQISIRAILAGFAHLVTFAKAATFAEFEFSAVSAGFRFGGWMYRRGLYETVCK